MRTILKIVAPTDFSDFSLQALDSALEMAKVFGARLFLVNVVQDPSAYVGTPEGGVAQETLRRTLIHEAEARLAALAPRLRGVDHDTAVRTGRIAPAILDYAREVDADLIVIATHGRKGIARFFIGSTTEHVLRRASCPVMTVRPHADQPVAEEAGLTGHSVHDHSCECVRDTIDFREVMAARGGPLRVRDAMRRDPVTVGPQAKIRDVVDLMIHHDLPGITVVDEEDRMLGYIPEGHLLRRCLAQLVDTPESAHAWPTVDDFIECQRHIYGQTARDLMRPVDTVSTVAESELLTEAVKRLLVDAVPRMPVLRGDKLVGYLTRADVLRVVRNLERGHEHPLTDEQVQKLVRQTLDRSPDVAITDLRIEVAKGLVTLRGSVTTAIEMKSATDIVRRIPGVCGVENQLLVEQMLK